MIIAWVNTGSQIADIIARFGVMLTFYVIFIIYAVIFGVVKVSWTCGLCGKPNTTNLLKFLLCWCDHFGGL